MLNSVIHSAFKIILSLDKKSMQSMESTTQHGHPHSRHQVFRKGAPDLT